MAAFPDAWITELLSKNDIVSVIADYTPLTQKGHKLWGLCPFHNEKTPSFSVSEDKQLYYCFGCHAGGTVVQFIMDVEKLSYIDAIRFLAARVGMELPESVNDEDIKKRRERRDRLQNLCKDVAKFYHEYLIGDNGINARNYLAKRKLDGKTITRFGLGLAPEGWTTVRDYMIGLGYSEKELVEAGVCQISTKNNRCYDAYRGRIIFPIISTNGKVIAFGARTMGDDKPKYINTGDTPIFNKRNNLYGMNLIAKNKPSDIIIVEGYMDVISLNKSGITNAVASLGTALTESQARLIKRFTKDVFISYDGDNAGQNAIMRGLDILAKEGLNIKVIVFPDNLDPDDYVKKYGKDAFETLKDSSISLNEFKLNFIAKSFDLSKEDDRINFARQACNFILKMEPVERDKFYRIVARMTGIDIESLKEQKYVITDNDVISNGRNRSRVIKRQRKKCNNAERIALEQKLLACMLTEKEKAFEIMQLIDSGTFSVPEFEKFVYDILTSYIDNDKLNVSLMLSSLDSSDAESIMRVLNDDTDILEPVDTAKDCIDGIKRIDLREQLTQISLEADRSDISDDLRKMLLTKQSEIIKKLNKLNKNKDTIM